MAHAPRLEARAQAALGGSGVGVGALAYDLSGEIAVGLDLPGMRAVD
ncbi:hypothetical protein [Achromobacter sp. UBA2119]|nr:hypothetical protein [Achromobacter sp. UBA2119]